MSNYLLSPADLRSAIFSAIQPEGAAELGPLLDLTRFFVPKSHARALNLSVPIVVGGQGTGKSDWWTALQMRSHREELAREAPDTRIKANTIIAPGSGNAATIQDQLSLDFYPAAKLMDELLDQFSAQSIWKTIIVWAVGRESEAVAEALPALESWQLKVNWLNDNTEAAERLLQSMELELVKADRDMLIVFDALDLITNDSRRLERIVEGLSQCALQLRSFRRLHAKVFLRSDQFDPQRIGRFADASKLKASSVRLHWLVTELYGMLWRLLANHPTEGTTYRQDVFTILFPARNQDFPKSQPQRQQALSLVKPDDWSLPSAAFFDPATQERLFHHLTGPYMGENARRGFPYKWLPTHLADAHGAISPRSFQIAIRAAAQHTEETNPDCLTAIGYKSLYTGVRQASDQRVREMAEAYAWIELLMQPLANQKLVPLDFAEIEDIWLDQGTLDHPELQRIRLNNAEAAKQALTSLGVVRPMSTGKYDMPDIYRLQFCQGRRGGIPLTTKAVEG
ncbi:MAG: hypothetical protein FJ083_15505 [Cyanobacteria bacterium K_Offshore_surface_m2_239]|nr:hypothetical protein [Cyanobacteria bacterium K_Offshore_surface_m2_239]